MRNAANTLKCSLAVPYAGYSLQLCRQAAQLLPVIAAVGLLSSGSFRMSEAPPELHLAVPGQSELSVAGHNKIMVAGTHVHSQAVLLCR